MNLKAIERQIAVGEARGWSASTMSEYRRKQNEALKNKLETELSDKQIPEKVLKI